MEIVNKADDGELLCLMDVDTMITGDLSEISEYDFDIAVTDKEGKQAKAPINTGVIFVRVSPKTKKFFRDWYTFVLDYICNPTLLKKDKRVYLGINQSALSQMMKTEHDVNLLLVPCRIWNSTTITWPLYNDQTKVVHILGKLRSAIFEKKFHNSGQIMKLSKLWKQYEIESVRVKV
jgi:hypothetical protein